MENVDTIWALRMGIDRGVMAQLQAYYSFWSDETALTQFDTLQFCSALDWTCKNHINIDKWPKVRINYDGMVPSLHTPKKTFLTPPTQKNKT